MPDPLSRAPLSVALALALAACAKPDRLAPCRDVGPIGHRAEAPACAAPACRACADALASVWRDRADPAQRNAFRARFMSAPTAARDVFCAAARPDGTYPFEHCTASLDEGARCAAYSPYCVSVLADALRGASTTLAERTQLNLAAGRACPAAREALVRSLSVCDDAPAAGTCEEGRCARCLAGRLAALTVVAPRADSDEGARAMDALVEGTPEPVARAVVEALGAPDAPADLETVVVQRSLRHYCFALVARSASAPPFACNAVMIRFLTHPEYGDAPRAWSALGAARPEVRSSVVSALLVNVARAPSLAADLRQGLAALPTDGTAEGIARAMNAPSVSDGAWAELRAELVRRGVSGAALPPVNRPSTPATAPAGVTSHPPPHVGAPLRTGAVIPSREG